MIPLTQKIHDMLHDNNNDANLLNLWIYLYEDTITRRGLLLWLCAYLLNSICNNNTANKVQKSSLNSKVLLVIFKVKGNFDAYIYFFEGCQPSWIQMTCVVCLSALRKFDFSSCCYSYYILVSLISMVTDKQYYIHTNSYFWRSFK